jgi:hypothetical protein
MVRNKGLLPLARPLELNDQIIEDVKRLAGRCLYAETIADYIGVHRMTFWKWMKAGGREQRMRDRGKEPNHSLDYHCKLSIVYKQALAETESEFLWTIQNAGSVHWQALAWIMERRNPKRWAQNRDQLRALNKSIQAMSKVLRGTSRLESASKTRPRRKLAKAEVE